MLIFVLITSILEVQSIGFFVLAIYLIYVLSKKVINYFKRKDEPDTQNCYGYNYGNNYKGSYRDNYMADDGSYIIPEVQGRMDLTIDCESESKCQKNIKIFMKDWMKKEGIRNYSGLIAEDIKYDKFKNEPIYECPQDEVFQDIIDLKNAVKKDGTPYISVSIDGYGEIGEIRFYDFKEIKNMVDRNLITSTEIKIDGGRYKYWNGEKILFGRDDYFIKATIRFEGNQCDFPKEAGYDWEKLEAEIKEAESL